MTTTTNSSLAARREAAVPRGVGNMMPVFAARAENAELWDVEGNRFIDFAGGIAVLATGHRHPKVMAAAQAQMEAVTHTCFHVAMYESYVDLAERLNKITPGNHAKKTMFATTGVEAVENAVKIARAATGRSAVIAFNGAFHGRTLLGMSLTGKVAPYKKGFGPFPAEIYHSQFPNPYRGGSVEEALDALKTLLATDVDPERVAAIIIEPIQGEGGFVETPAEFMRGIRAVCDQYGIVMIVDEIQTGFARTGKMFAIEHADVIPDLMTMAKSLGGGFPLSAVTGKAEIMDAAAPGGLGGTYAGNPISCAAGLAVLDVIEEEKLIDRAVKQGERIRARLTAMAATEKFACIGDIRGKGAMIGIEFVQNRVSKIPAAEIAKGAAAEAAKNGLIVLTCGTHYNVVRLLAPLTASDAIIDEALDILEAAITKMVA